MAKKIIIPYGQLNKVCGVCGGSGNKPCYHCEQTGRLEDGSKCYLCQGAGYVECDVCNGYGYYDD